jgi:hypothetical protein
MLPHMSAAVAVAAGPRPAASTRRSVGLQYLALGIVALAVGALHLKHRPASLCVLRTVTGIPCPFCGGTTAAADLGNGQLAAALAASPLAIAVFALGPLLRVWRRPAWWANRHLRWAAIVGLLVVSEVWQLARFGIISL